MKYYWVAFAIGIAANSLSIAASAPILNASNVTYSIEGFKHPNSRSENQDFDCQLNRLPLKDQLGDGTPIPGQLQLCIDVPDLGGKPDAAARSCLRQQLAQLNSALKDSRLKHFVNAYTHGMFRSWGADSKAPPANYLFAEMVMEDYRGTSWEPDGQWPPV